MFATVHLVHPEHMIDFYRRGDQVATAKRLIAEGKYTAVKTLCFDNLDTIEAIADEVFDLTNNPSRQEERDELYGNHRRSLSVGDIVAVGGEALLCCSFGWQRVEV